MCFLCLKIEITFMVRFSTECRAADWLGFGLRIREVPVSTVGPEAAYGQCFMAFTVSPAKYLNSLK
jgi:hypothetical protein